MSATTAIEWTDRTWNPVRGCSVVSPGCVHCYAMKQAHRFSGPGRAYEGLTKLTSAGPQWTGLVRPVPEALLEPLSWRKPARVFVNSMSDLFHEDVSDAFIDQVFAVMALAQHLTFQVLTKRPARMLDYLKDEYAVRSRLLRIVNSWADDAMEISGWLRQRGWPELGEGGEWPLPNVWLGVSVEDQQRADARIPLLLQTPAAVRFISAEPLLGSVDLSGYLDDLSVSAPAQRVKPMDWVAAGLDWMIVGGESGPGARPCEVEWVRSVVRQCQKASVPVFVKQLGAVPLVPAARIRHWEWGGEIRSDREAAFEDYRASVEGARGWRAVLDNRKGGDPSEWPEDLRVREFPRLPASEGRR